MPATAGAAIPVSLGRLLSCSAMYGPLNGVRAALVTLAILAALAAAILGHWTVTLVLGIGVALHGLGWLYLAQQAERRSDPPS